VVTMASTERCGDAPVVGEKKWLARLGLGFPET
jgi:hypothetical protein